MLDEVLDLLRCPHCCRDFIRQAGSVRCAQGHSFDIAKQGHLNLMGRAPGQNADTADMVAARLRVLAAGIFDPLTHALTDAVAAAASNPPAGPTLVDAGAGPGHHLGRILANIGGRGLACDVSPLACRRAAKVDRVGAVVADTWAGLPVADDAADVALSVFAPRNWADFARITRGPVVIAAPLSEHLRTLRAERGLLQIEDDKFEQIDQRAAAAGLQRVRHVDVEEQVQVGPELAADLVQMGPNAFHAAGRASAPDPAAPGVAGDRASAHRQWPVELAVRVATYALA